MKRMLFAAPMALVMAFGVFSFMAWMVDNGKHTAPKPTAPLSFNMVMVENEQDVQRRQRSLPEKPKMPQAPQQSPASQPQEQQQVSAVNEVQAVASLGLDTSIHGLAISAPTFGDFGVNQQAMPINRVEPRYPLNAQKRRIEGFVSLSFTIDKTGRPTDIEVVDADPKQVFDREAIRALRQWKYQPQIVDGKAVEQPGQTVKVEFKLAQ